MLKVRVKSFSVTERDDAILCQIYKTMTDHPNNSKYKLCMQIMFWRKKYVLILKLSNDPEYICIIHEYRSLNKNNLSKIFENPDAALNILTEFGFVATRNNRQLVYQPLPVLLHVPTMILTIYSSPLTHNLSEKLFEAIWNQVFNAKDEHIAHSLQIYFPFQSIAASECDDSHDSINTSNSMRSNYSHCVASKNKYNGVYVCDVPSTMSTKLLLMNELFELPNQYHCFSWQFGEKVIWILNNDGKAYENIDWTNMDWKIMIDKLSYKIFCAISKCIEYCLKHNQLIFLKKILYFLTDLELHDETNPWPQFIDEHIVMQLRKYSKIIKNHTFFIDEIVEIFDALSIECKVHNTMYNIASLCSEKVDNFVQNVIVPTMKSRLCTEKIKNNINRLKQKTHWKCFICEEIHLIDVQTCHICAKNKTFRSKILSLNPYYIFIENESTLFNIDKWFGVIEYRKSANGINFQLQRKNGILISVICDFAILKTITIVFDARDSLTIGELKILIYELMSNKMGNGKYREMLHVSFQSHEIFGKMKDEDVVPRTTFDTPYFMSAIEHIHIDHRIKEKYKIYFGKKHCNFQCPFMIAEKSKSKDSTRNFNLDPFKHCPYFSDIDDGDEIDIDKVYDHLSNFDHFKSFDIIQNHCPLKNDCPRYQRILQIGLGNYDYNCTYDHNSTRNKQSIFNDKKHVYLYYHPSSKCRNSFDVESVGACAYANKNVDGNDKLYDCILERSSVTEIAMNQIHASNIEIRDRENDPDGLLFVTRLIYEVITNDYIKDLRLIEKDYKKEKKKKKHERHKTKGNKKIFGNKEYLLDELEALHDEWITTFGKCYKSHADKRTLTQTSKQLRSKFENFYSNTFGIFQVLKKKVNHSRHKKMGCPLHMGQMLALILYCNGDCNYDLCLSQRNNTCDKKWPMFDYLLNDAINILSRFEEHWENIYTGVCGIFYKFTNDYCIRDIVFCKANVSFTTDLQIAKQFRGSSGMIIGLNLKRSFAAIRGEFSACDVSWISKYPNEKEILVSRRSQIRIYRNKMTQTRTKNGDKQQWFVCDEGNLQETSFQSMFC